jgi:hypothetical protein
MVFNKILCHLAVVKQLVVIGSGLPGGMWTCDAMIPFRYLSERERERERERENGFTL